MSEWILYACASAVLGGLLPSLVKTGVRRAAPAAAAAVYAAVAFLFALGAAAIAGTLGAVPSLNNGELVRLLAGGLLRALVWLCLFTALSTGGVSRVTPIVNLAPAIAAVLGALLFGGQLGVWRLCCLVLLLLGTVLMESRQQKGKGCRWLLFSLLALLCAAGHTLAQERLLAGVAASVRTLMESLMAAVLLSLLALAGRSFQSLKKLRFDEILYLLLSGVATGLAALCDAAAARFGDTTYLLPIACCAFPLTLLFARLLHKEKIPASALLGLVFAVAACSRCCWSCEPCAPGRAFTMRRENGMYRLCAFDLDGTLADTIEDLAGSLNYALTKNGLPALPARQVLRLVGHSVDWMCRMAVPEPQREALHAQVFADCDAHYARHCCDHTRPYEGILRTLSRLRAAGVTLAVVTNKPHRHAMRVVDALFRATRSPWCSA